MASKSAQQEQQEKAEAIEELLDHLDKTLDRVKVLYEQFFLGIQKQPPSHLHLDVERKLRDLQQMQIRNTALRYRFATIQQKFGAYNNYWRRTLRQIENGTYHRNLAKIGRQAALTGEDIPEEILAAMPARMREQVKRDREAALARARRRDQTVTDDEFGDELGEAGTNPVTIPPRTRDGAHVLDESDAEFDLDAYFASVTNDERPDDTRPDVRAPAAQAAFEGELPTDFDAIDPPTIQRAQVVQQTPAVRAAVGIATPPAGVPVAPRVTPAGMQNVPPSQRPSGGHPAVSGPRPPSGGPTASGSRSPSGDPAVPGSRSPSGGHPPVPASRPPSGGHPAVSGSRSPSGGHPAVPGSRSPSGGHPAVPGSPSGGHPAVSGSRSPGDLAAGSRSRSPSGGHPAVPGSPSGGHPAVSGSRPPSGGHPAIPAPPSSATRQPAAPSQVARPLPVMPGSSATRPAVPVETLSGPFPREQSGPQTPSSTPATTPAAQQPPATTPAQQRTPATPAAQRTPATTPAPQRTPVRPGPPPPPPGRTQGIKPIRAATEPGVAPAKMAPPPGMTDADVNALYAKYVKAKEAVGEKAGPGSYGKLLQTINQQAPKIMEQYKAKGVDFQVVVKDNQVVIRAKPKV